jgi:hypothetical protein
LGRGIKATGYFHDGTFPHAIDRDIGTAIHENGSANRVAPVVVVGEAAQARFETAGDDEDTLTKGLSQQITVDG